MTRFISSMSKTYRSHLKISKVSQGVQPETTHDTNHVRCLGGGGNGRCITVGSILISLLTTCFADYASYGSWEEMTEKPGCVSAQTNIVRKWDDLIDDKYLKLHTDKHVQTELQGAVCQRRCLRKAPMKKCKVKYVSNSTHARAE